MFLDAAFPGCAKSRAIAAPLVRATGFPARFAQLREGLDLHPQARWPSEAFTRAAATARAIGADDLPLAIGAVMHLYPLCALQHAPLPWFSPAAFKRAALVTAVRRKKWIVANAGSQRAPGKGAEVVATLAEGGVQLEGTFEYVSLASVADVVLFKAPLADGRAVFCVADLNAPGVSVGAGRFSGSMAMSDTRSVRFANAFVPRSRCVISPEVAALQCIADYQRAWFHLLLSEIHLARIEKLHEQHELTLPADAEVSLREFAWLRDLGSRLLDAVKPGEGVERLVEVAATLKQRVTVLAQATATQIQPIDAEAASELRVIPRWR